jgi:hypothetical protein
VIKSAVHRGVIVWRDASKKIKKWNCHVVAAWSTIADARRALVSAHPDAQIETWNGGAMLEKGTIVELAAPVKDVLPQGRYVVAGAKSSGEIRFHGNDSTFSVSVLIEIGQMRVIS